MLPWIIVLVIWIVALIRKTHVTSQNVADLHERVFELECTAMREGWTYMEDVVSADERCFYQPRSGEDQGEG